MMALELFNGDVGDTIRLRVPTVLMISLVVVVVVKRRLAASEVTIGEGSILSAYLVSDLPKFTLRLRLLLGCRLGLFLQVDELSSKYFLLLRHLILKLSELIFEVGLQSFADILDDLGLVDRRLTVLRVMCL